MVSLAWVLSFHDRGQKEVFKVKNSIFRLASELFWIDWQPQPLSLHRHPQVYHLLSLQCLKKSIIGQCWLTICNRQVCDHLKISKVIWVKIYSELLPKIKVSTLYTMDRRWCHREGFPGKTPRSLYSYYHSAINRRFWFVNSRMTKSVFLSFFALNGCLHIEFW